jgi:DNA-binding response OmpR family regulator
MAIVLMVEDEEQIRVLAESVLEEAGHKVITATGVEGSKAVSRLTCGGGIVRAGLRMVSSRPVSL